MNKEIISQKFEDVERIDFSEDLNEFIDAFKEIRNIAEANGYIQEVKEAQYEIDVLSLRTSHDDNERFHPLVILKDGRKWPSLEEIEQERIIYYEKRLDSTDNVFLKSRYADFLFEYGGNFINKNKYEISLQLIPSLKEVSEIYLHQEPPRYFKFIDELSRVVEVSLKMGNKEGLKENLIVLKNALERLENNKEYRWAIDLSNLLRNILNSKHANLVEIDTCESCFTALHNGKKYFWVNQEYHLHRSVCEEIMMWKRLEWLSTEEFNSLQVEIGQSFEEEAVHQQGREEKSNLVKAHFYELAMRHYANIGETEKINEMKVLIRKSYEEVEENNELTQFSTEVSIPNSELRKIIKTYSEIEGEKAIEKISSSAFFPSYKVVEEQTKEQLEDNPIQNLFSKGVLDDGKKIDSAVGEDDSFRLAFAQNYILHLQFNLSLLLTPIFDELLSEGKLDLETLNGRIANWSLIPDKNKKFIEDGIKKYLEEDYVSSIHILVPHFESTLRRLFSSLGFATTSIKRGNNQHEETFNEFLNREDIVNALGENLHLYISMITVSQNGLNLRNRVAHGLITHEECNRETNTLMVYLFLLLTNFKVVSEKNV